MTRTGSSEPVSERRCDRSIQCHRDRAHRDPGRGPERQPGARASRPPRASHVRVLALDSRLAGDVCASSCPSKAAYREHRGGGGGWGGRRLMISNPYRPPGRFIAQRPRRPDSRQSKRGRVEARCAASRRERQDGYRCARSQTWAFGTSATRLHSGGFFHPFFRVRRANAGARQSQIAIARRGLSESLIDLMIFRIEQKEVVAMLDCRRGGSAGWVERRRSRLPERQRRPRGCRKADIDAGLQSFNGLVFQRHGPANSGRR